MDLRRIPTGQLITTGAGIALLVVMLGLDWYRVEGTVLRLNAFEAFTWVDIVLLATAIVAIELVLIAGAAARRRPRIVASSVAAAFGILAIALVVYRIVVPPDLAPEQLFEPAEGTSADRGFDSKRAIGVYLGLLASAAIAYGGARSIAEEQRAEPRARSQAATGAAPSARA